MHCPSGAVLEKGCAAGATYWAYHAARLAFFIPLLATSLLWGAARRGELQSGTITFVNPMSADRLANVIMVCAMHLCGGAYTCLEPDQKSNYTKYKFQTQSVNASCVTV